MQRRVLLFIRAPELGRVKTRLEKEMDAKTVLTLYRLFVEDTLAGLVSGGYDILVFFSPPHQESLIDAWLGNTVHCRPQKGKNLGERMRHAFASVFDGGVDQAVLMGSDIPDLDMGIVHEAFAFLENRDVVIGPAQDGGYYLIGFRKNAFDGDVFTGIDWGTERVYRQTMQRIRDAGLNEHVLPTWQDIDTHEDLGAFYHRSKTRGHVHLKTMTFLQQLDMKGFP